MAVREIIDAGNSWWERLDRKPRTWEAFEKALRMEFVPPKTTSQVIQDMCHLSYSGITIGQFNQYFCDLITKHGLLFASNEEILIGLYINSFHNKDFHYEIHAHQPKTLGEVMERARILFDAKAPYQLKSRKGKAVNVDTNLLR